MLAITQTADQIPAHVRIGKSPSIFAHANMPGVNLVIWERKTTDKLDHAIDFLRTTTMFHLAGKTLTRGLPDDMIVSFAPSFLQRTLQYLANPVSLFQQGMTTSLTSPEIEKIKNGFNQRRPGADCLAEDSIYLMKLYHHVFPKVKNIEINPFFQLSVERTGPLRVHQDGRRGEEKWRMITTYDGPETVWTPNDNVDRATFRKSEGESEVINPERVYGIGPRSVALIKGGPTGVYHSGPRGPVRVPRMGSILIPEFA